MASQHGVYHTKCNTVNDTLKSFVAYENAKMCQHRVWNTITELKTRAPKGCKRRTGAKGGAKKCQNTRTGKKGAEDQSIRDNCPSSRAWGIPPPTHQPPNALQYTTDSPPHLHPPKCRTSIHHTGFNKYLFVFSFQINMIAVAELSCLWSIDKMARRQRCRFEVRFPSTSADTAAVVYGAFSTLRYPHSECKNDTA